MGIRQNPTVHRMTSTFPWFMMSTLAGIHGDRIDSAGKYTSSQQPRLVIIWAWGIIPKAYKITPTIHHVISDEYKQTGERT